MTDVLWDLQAAHWHHGDGSSGGEPVGFVISAGIVAHLIDVAVNKWHGAEARQAGASKTWVGEGGGEWRREQRAHQAAAKRQELVKTRPR